MQSDNGQDSVQKFDREAYKDKQKDEKETNASVKRGFIRRNTEWTGKNLIARLYTFRFIKLLYANARERKAYNKSFYSIQKLKTDVESVIQFWIKTCDTERILIFRASADFKEAPLVINEDS